MDNDEDFVFMPDEEMSAVEAAAEEKEIGMGEMMKIIFVQWYEQKSHRENRLHKRGWREIPAEPIFHRTA